MSASRAQPTAEELERELEAEREQLARAVEQLRGELGVTAKLRKNLPLLTGGSVAAGFVLSGGIGAGMRYLARRSREK
jgi:hypothetical protein